MNETNPKGANMDEFKTTVISCLPLKIVRAEQEKIRSNKEAVHKCWTRDLCEEELILQLWGKVQDWDYVVEELTRFNA